MAKKLTIGMAVYDDFDGVYFSIQAMRMFHPEILDEVEFLIIDNNPDGPHAKAIKKLANHCKDTRYIPFKDYKSTAIRNEIFSNANTPYVLSMDCHVLFEAGSLKKLINYYDANSETRNLIQGPLLYDNLTSVHSHFKPVWSEQMFGIWDVDERAKDPNGAPFEIPMQGLGVFSCLKDAWAGFNPLFRGFGGEEGYIHGKYRKRGDKVLCLPFLRWVHRFDRPNGVRYPLDLNDRIRNYLIGHLELGLSPRKVIDHFSMWRSQEDLNAIYIGAVKDLEESRVINV